MKPNYEFKKFSSIIILCALCIVLVFSCGQKEKPVVIPANILPKEKMARVLTDFHLAEAGAEVNFPDSTKREPINFQKIFKKDTITQQQYEESLAFYVDHPEILNKVYEEVVNELSKMQGTTSKQ
jgi:hypothetical protein